MGVYNIYFGILTYFIFFTFGVPEELRVNFCLVESGVCCFLLNENSVTVVLSTRIFWCQFDTFCATTIWNRRCTTHVGAARAVKFHSLVNENAITKSIELFCSNSSPICVNKFNPGSLSIVVKHKLQRVFFISTLVVVSNRP